MNAMGERDFVPFFLFLIRSAEAGANFVRDRTRSLIMEYMIDVLSPKTRNRFLLGIAVSLFCFASNATAQNYIGGSFSISNNVNQVSSSSERRNNSFGVKVAPDFGRELGERWAVGIRPTLGFNRNTGGSQKDYVFSFGVNPYARYQLLTAKRFGLWAEASPYLRYNLSRTKSEGVGGSYSNESRILNYGIQLLPVLTYQLGRHVSLETQLNIFSFALNGTHSANISHTSNSTQTSGTFTCGLSATSKDILGSLGDITLGFLYHF